MKICNRSYAGNSILTVEIVDGVDLCPLCKKPAQLHGATVERRVLFWSLAGDTGISSEAIAAHMTGIKSNARWGMRPPADASDRGRCIRLLELIPEWIERLPEMVQYDTKKQGGLMIDASGLHAYEGDQWATQIPKIMAEGRL